MENLPINQIKALEARWITCYLAKDTSGLADLLAEDFMYSSERGVFGKKEYVANLASGVIEMRGLANLENHFFVHGDTVVSIGVSDLDASFQGQDISGQDRFTRVWQKQGPSYQALALHASKKSEAP
jgi:ketosteroid isomerase-like protein